MAKHEGFQTIPKAPNYEVNRSGVIRNKKTGKIVHWQSKGKTKRVNLRNNGNYVCVTFPALMWILFGKLAPETKVRVPVTISKGRRFLHFDSCRQCAIFLAKKEYYSVARGLTLLVRREKEIFGWKVKYLR